jgi:proton glutamate symport protein
MRRSGVCADCGDRGELRFCLPWPLAKLVILVHFAILFFALVVLGIVARLCGLSIWILIRILKDELILAYSTASSESVLPRIIEKMEAYGAPASITSFVVPTGYSFNLDGSTLYQSIAAIFIAQLYGIDLSLWQEIVLVLTLMVTSKGIAGVPGVSFVVLLATLGSVGIPLEGLAFIAGVDRILDMARTALNVVGNALAVLVIAKWEHKFDRKKRWRMNARCWVVLIRRPTSKSPVALRLPGLRFCRPGKRSRHPALYSPLNASNSSHPVSNPSVQLRFNQ